ncbi:MAG TPA: GNAT family N-acetyltransferase [Candidatus Dependentiae bacterium]|nr:GNAT family N-acetyltransferase [Candidatus Dependentiae bacterium]HRQ62367.1 GNAT family N-acetyltransferase [Candidatus Dependentiae bacterium]
MNKFLIIVFTCFFSSLVAIADEYNFRLATPTDLDSLVNLMNKEASTEEGIVIPPKKFRSAYFQSAIENNELFVVTQGEHIIGYKKLFVIDDQEKQLSILEDEIRCQGADSELIYNGVISYENNVINFFEHNDQQLKIDNAVYIYNGGDFTKKEYRGQGLNKLLMQKALDSIASKVIDYIQHNKSAYIALLYGITENNGSYTPGAMHDRTRPIVSQFVPFAQHVAACIGYSSKINSVLHTRYRAFKPSFDQESTEFKPLSDEYAVPGAGVVLAFPLKKEVLHED